MKFAAHVGEGGREHVLDLGVDGGDHPSELATCRTDVFELFFEERVPGLELVELLERERIDRAEQSQLAFEFADTAGRRGALGDLRHLCGFGDRRLDVELPAQRLDRRLESQLRLGLLEFGLARPLPGDVELLLLLRPLTAQGVEFGRELADLVALLAAGLDQLGVMGLDDRAMGVDHDAESIDHAHRPFDHDSLPLGGITRLGIGFEPAFGFGDPPFEDLAMLDQPGIADFEVLALRRERGRALLQLGSQLTTGTRRIGLGLLVGFEGREQRFEFTDALLLTLAVLGCLLDRAIERLQLGTDLSLLALRTSQSFRCRGQLGVVAHRDVGSARCSLALRRHQLVAGGRDRQIGSLQARRREVGLRLRLVERRSGRSRSGRPDPPSAESESVAGFGDDHRLGVGDGGIECLGRGRRSGPHRRAVRRAAR